jgi:hypothetical protein
MPNASTGAEEFIIREAFSSMVILEINSLALFSAGFSGWLAQDASSSADRVRRVNLRISKSLFMQT